MLGQLHDIDLQLLRIFVCVAECGGFSAAQGELGITQSTISTQMAKLETRLGVRLCERGKGGFRLTAEGEQVLGAVRRLYQAIDDFTGEARGLSGRLVGELRVGISEALGQAVIERVGHALKRFRQRDQAVNLELISAAPAELERRLLQDQLHLAVGYFFSGNQSALEYQALFSETQRLYCAAGHPLFSAVGLNTEQLLQCDQVHHPYRFGPMAEPVRSARSTARAEQVEASLAFILSGAHTGYLPEHVAAPWLAAGQLRALLPEELGFTVQFYLAEHRGQQASEARKAFTTDLLGAFQ